MRRPKKRGAAVDTRRISNWTSRFRGYRQEVTRERIEDWLGQFAGSDRDLAARVLDAVTYVTHESIERIFQRILNRLPGWHASKRKRRGKWRFVAFSRAAGESGDTMLHRWRSAAGLGSRQYDVLFINKRDLLMEELGPNDTVVFLDDFSGTGNQVCQGWHEIMAELLPGEPTTFLVLVAASVAARQRIGRETPLRVECGVRLGMDDNILSGKCGHFSRAEKETLLRYCRRANRRLPRGYGDCGFVIVLAHKTPNNSIPILYVTTQRWQGLFPRY